MGVRGSVGTGVALVATVFALAACGEPARPDLASWEPRWQMATATVEEVSDQPDVPSRQQCEGGLGELRELRPDSVPTPDELIDEAVDAWFGDAEHLLFTCPRQASEFDRLHEELARRQAEVETLLADLRGGPG